jgi:hypothetical protein
MNNLRLKPKRCAESRRRCLRPNGRRRNRRALPSDNVQALRR